VFSWGKEITHVTQIKAFYLSLRIISNNIIIFQNPVALVNDLTCRDRLRDELLVALGVSWSTALSLFTNVICTTYFDLIRLPSGRYF
jgi:hypothetical protein